MKRKTTKKLSNFKLPQDLAAKLTSEAKKQRRTKTALVEMALQSFFAMKVN